MEVFKNRVQSNSDQKKEIRWGEQVKPPVKLKPKPKKHNPQSCYLAYFMLMLKFST